MTTHPNRRHPRNATPWIALAHLTPEQLRAIGRRFYTGHPSNWPKPHERRAAYRFDLDTGEIVGWSETICAVGGAS